MNKINIYIVFLLALFTYKINANATNYLDINKYDYTKEGSVYVVGDLSGERNQIQSLFENDEGDIIFVASYIERDRYAGKGYPKLPSTATNKDGEVIAGFSKIGKINSNYELEWEAKMGEIGSYVNKEPFHELTGATFSDVIQLKDGSYVGGGISDLKKLPESVVEELGLEDGAHFASGILARFDRNGNETFNQHFFDEVYSGIVALAPLEDGGYVAKIKDAIKPGIYLVFDSENKIVDSFSLKEEEKLHNLGIIEKKDLYKLIFANNTEFKGSYKGISINNEAYFIESGNSYKEFPNVNVYNPDTKKLLRTFNVGEINNIKADMGGRFFHFLNDGGIMMEHKTFTSDGILVNDFKNTGIKEEDKQYLTTQKPGDPVAIIKKTNAITYITENGISIVKSNGDWVFLISEDYKSNYRKFKVEVKSQTNTSEDFANYIINGKKVEFNLGTFIENDRTYISLNNLCSVLDCTYKRSKENKNKLIIDFDIFNRGNNKMVDISEADKTSVSRKVKYTIVHEIGSKSYTTYLSFQPLKIFRLNSPTYNENEVDVASIERDGQIYVPLRFISEALGRYVTYEPAKDGGKPTINIGAYGEGDFYEKYGVAISYDKLQENDILTSTINETALELEWNMAKLVYGYGYIKAENKVISVDKTIFVPGQTRIIKGAQELEYNDLDASGLTNNYKWLRFESKDNWIGKMKLHYDNNGEEGDPYYGDGTYETFFVVSNIEGYPFIKIVKFT